MSDRELLNYADFKNSYNLRVEEQIKLWSEKYTLLQKQGKKCFHENKAVSEELIEKINFTYEQIFEYSKISECLRYMDNISSDILESKIKEWCESFDENNSVVIDYDTSNYK